MRATSRSRTVEPSGLARSTMAPNSFGDESWPFTSTSADTFWPLVLGSAPMLPEATWAFWALIAFVTSSAVRLNPTSFSGSTQTRSDCSVEYSVARPTPGMRRISPSTLRTMKSPSATSSMLPSVEVRVMICNTALEASSIRIPCCKTARGRRDSMRLMRFCTSTDAISTSVPGTKLAVISTWPSESLVDSKFRMPPAPFNSSSISRVTLL